MKAIDYALRHGEADVIRCLFFHGPTWDGNIPSKAGRDTLCKRGFVVHAFGYAWLTREGVEFAIKVMEMGRLKEAWENRRRPPYLDFKL